MNRKLQNILNYFNAYEILFFPQVMSTPETETKESVKRVIVEKDLLINLFKVCKTPGCGSVIDRDDIQVTTKGAAVSIRAICSKSHEHKWDSSSKVGESKKQMFLINIILAVYVVLCGLDISQVLIMA